MGRKVIIFFFALVLNCIFVSVVYPKSTETEDNVVSPINFNSQYFQELNSDIQELRVNTAQIKDKLDILDNAESKSSDINIVEIMFLIISVVLLSVCIYIIVLLRNLMTKVDVLSLNSNSGRAETYQSLELGGKISAIDGKVSDLRNQIDEISKKIDSFVLPPNSINPSKTLKKSEVKTEPKNLPEKNANTQKQQKHEQYYAMPQNEASEIILSLSQEDNYKEYVPFILDADGNQGTVTFNVASIKNALSNFEIDVKPFAECIINNDTPTSVKTSKLGKGKFENGNWVLVEKPLLIFE